MLRCSKRKSKSPYARPVRTPTERSIADTAPVITATQVSQPASQTANSSVATLNPPEVPQLPEVPHSASVNSEPFSGNLLSTFYRGYYNGVILDIRSTAMYVNAITPVFILHLPLCKNSLPVMVLGQNFVRLWRMSSCKY
ncbi:uncharacterized protein LOC134244523 [Saccostrea cucullata]|uniref:uncharacterized protein LOC134244523 n=1 Tax=Saccostrea cuccullata TaxID=36930 RepID=UPI002ED0CD90